MTSSFDWLELEPKFETDQSEFIDKVGKLSRTQGIILL